MDLIVPEYFSMRLGGNVFEGVHTIVAFNNEPLFSVDRRQSDGLLRIDFEIYDSQQKKVAVIRGNRIVAGNEADYEFDRPVNRYRVIDKASGRVLCDVQQRNLSGEA